MSKNFRKPTLVLKCGGQVLVDELAMDHFFDDVAELSVHYRLVLVHGGGAQISHQLNRAGILSVFVDGLRVTDDLTMRIVEEVLVSQVNRRLTDSLRRAVSIPVHSVSGKAAQLFFCKKMFRDTQDIGWVGDIVEVNLSGIAPLLQDDSILVVAPIGTDQEGHSYNISADYAAAALAESLKADRLVYVTGTRGVFRQVEESIDSIGKLSISMALSLILDGTINGGMIPKIESSIQSLIKGVKQVDIIEGTKQHSLWDHISGHVSYGTEVQARDTKEEEVRLLRQIGAGLFKEDTPFILINPNVIMSNYEQLITHVKGAQVF